jgi:hypothetical protein
MSRGPVGKGVSYWATIRIDKEMSEAELQALVAEIKRVIGNKGKVVDEARASSDGESSFAIGFRNRGGG